MSTRKSIPGLMQHWCAALNSKLDPEAHAAFSKKVVWWEHVCVDGRMRREFEQKRVDHVVCQFEQTGRLLCKACAVKEYAALSAEKHGRLIDRD